jgi:hypothetical protein
VVPVPSALVNSAVLLAGLNAPGQTVVIEQEATRDHTERMLEGFGAEITTEETDEGRVITLTGRPELKPQVIAVPRDPSSAAFPVCAALITPGSDVLVPGIGLNPTRAGLFTTLREMGADLTYENERIEGGEPVADLRAKYSPDMKGIEVPPERPTACAPNRASGSVTRAMGRLLRLASPVKVTVVGEVAMVPMISRTPVPELPQSITLSGSAKPPTPTPKTDQLPPPWFTTSAPKACIALAVSSTSSPSRSPVIFVSPTAMAPRISERCEIDLSPGTSATPESRSAR